MKTFYIKGLKGLFNVILPRYVNPGRQATITKITNRWRCKIINNLKLGDISNITTGLVVKRKKATPGDEKHSKYKILTLKSFDHDGGLNDESLENFESFEEIDSKYLTKVGDVIIRMSSPYTAITIDKEHENILVPSLFVMLRLKKESLLPEYISAYLNSTQMEKNYLKESSGSTIQTIRTSAFKDFEIPVLELEYQQKAAELSGLIKKEKQLLQALIEKKDLLNNAIMTQILNGGFKNGRN